MANIYDYIQNNIGDDGLVTGVNYNFQESPSTQVYHQVAAQNNPDYAQAIGDIYRWGDVNRTNFNLGLDTLTGLNNKKYLEKTRNEQRAYAEKLADKKFAQEKELMKLKSMFTLRNALAAKSNSVKNVVNKNNTVNRSEDYKYDIATDMKNRNLPTINNFYNTEGFNGINSTNFKLDKLKKEADNLNMIRNILLDPTQYPGTSKKETQYLLDNLFDDYIKRVEAFNAQEPIYAQTAAQSDADVGKNYISNLINSNDLNFDDKNTTLKQYINDKNAQIPTEGWNSSADLQQIYQYLINNNIDLSNKYPIQNGDDISLYDINTGNIEDIMYDENGNIVLKPIEVEQTDYLSKLKDILFYNKIYNKIKSGGEFIGSSLANLFNTQTNNNNINNNIDPDAITLEEIMRNREMFK